LIILASQSPRRQQILSWIIGENNFKIIPADINEAALAKLARTPDEMVEKIAIAKAKKVASILSSSFLKRTDARNEQPGDLSKIRNRQISPLERGRPKAGVCLTNKLIPNSYNLIIASDTAIILAQGKDHWQQFGKPKDKQDAKNILKTLSGKTHHVFTGICVITNPKPNLTSAYIKTEVTFKDYTDQDIKNYLNSFHWQDKAGAYAIQEDSIKPKILDHFTGSYTNILGLPAAKTVNLLKDFGVKIKPDWEERIKKEINYQE
jgi:septum formation protein